MSNSEKLRRLLDGFNEWHSRYGLDWQTYNTLIAALEVQDESENRVAVFGLSDNETPQRIAQKPWKIVSCVHGNELPTLQSVTKEFQGFDEATIRSILCRARVSDNKREVFEFVNEAFRILSPGGGILIEQVYAPNLRDEPTRESFLFFQHALKFIGLVIAEVFVPLPDGERAESRVTFVCQKPLNDGGPLLRRFEEAVRALRSYHHYWFPPAAVSPVEVAGHMSTETTEIVARLKSDMLVSEAAVAALSETALGAADIGRRLLKVERRILEIRKQTSIFYPITYPWSRLASVALGYLKTAKDKRRERRGKQPQSGLDSHDDGPASPGLEVTHPKSSILGETPRILILKLDHIGDFLLAIPAVELLRQAWPGAHITLVCSPTNEGLARSSRLFDEIRVFKFAPEMSEDVKKIDQKMYACISSVVPDAFDLAIDLRHDPDSRPFLSFVNADVRAGFEAHGKYYTPLDITIPLLAMQNGLHRSMHAVHRLMLLASHVINNLKPLPFDSAGSRLKSGEPDLDLAALGSFVVFAPGGGTRAKKWSPDRFAELANEVVKHYRMKVVLLGGPAEVEYGVAMRSVVPEGAFLDLVGKLPLVNVPMVLNKASALVGTDTGVTHLAALLGRPTVVLFSGVADVHTWHPFGPEVTVVRAPTGCSPCQIAKLEQCVAEHACMSAIDVETAFRALSIHLASEVTGYPG